MSEYKALANCSNDNQKCGADDKTDGAATLSAISANCTTQAAALTACQAAAQ